MLFDNVLVRVAAPAFNKKVINRSTAQKQVFPSINERVLTLAAQLKMPLE